MVAQRGARVATDDDGQGIAGPLADLIVPECPVLAPAVELVGEFRGSGYEARQWLVQRDGQFIQVSELLYRVAEQADGEHTLDQIAATLTDTTDWLVTSDHVRQIIQTKLMPMGLVTSADAANPVRAGLTAHSPLAVTVRSRVLGPRAIDPFARVLQIFYAPPVLIIMLAMIAAGHVWLYFVQGVAGGASAILQTPSLFLLVIAILLASAVFHEFGHAAALRYGGGRARGMGAGLYLVYPMFYTDTTDSYRLGRWARVRTGLGGVYFNLISAVAVLALYWLTGQEFLLLVVPLINFDIIRQFLPFGRLDGYWVLSDLTGVPDFFSETGAFLRSVLPLPGRKRGTLTHLKRWVKVSLALYLLIAIPVMAVMLVLLIYGVPRLLVALWTAAVQQAETMVQAPQQGNLALMVAALVQMMFLVLQAVAITYMLHTLIWRSLQGVWRWSKPSLPRRAAGTLLTTGAVALLGFLWVPQLDFLHRTALTGVQQFDVADRNHVPYPVVYAQTPPVGGDHAPIWQNCGFYAEEIPSMTAVHSMEHGAVWITYRPELSPDQVAQLRAMATRQGHILISLAPDLPSPVVASAWGHQLQLAAADDPRLAQFVAAFRGGPQAPERGGACTGGVGTPA